MVAVIVVVLGSVVVADNIISNTQWKIGHLPSCGKLHTDASGNILCSPDNNTGTAYTGEYPYINVSGSIIGLNLSAAQQRVVTGCAVGSSIRLIDVQGNVTCEIDTDSTIPDTNANTICAGTSVYLDGEGNCDTLTSGVNNYTETCTITGTTTKTGSCNRTGMTNYSFSWTDIGHTSIWIANIYYNESEINSLNTMFNTSMKTYADTQDVMFNNSIETYVNSQNTSLNTYINSQDVMFNTSMKNYADTQDATKYDTTGGELSGHVNMTGHNITNTDCIFFTSGGTMCSV